MFREYAQDQHMKKERGGSRTEQKEKVDHDVVLSKDSGSPSVSC